VLVLRPCLAVTHTPVATRVQTSEDLRGFL